MTQPHPDRADKVATFRELHTRGFVIPNPFDAGSAKLLQAMGFEALASTSAGFACTLGRPDGATARDEAMRHLQALCSAVAIPVSADLENAYADEPAGVARTIALAAAAGCAGGSVEDGTGRAQDPIYPFELAVERVRAAAEAARGTPGGFVLTARSENFLWGRPDLADTIRRLQAYQEAGADVLFAPGLTRSEDIAAVLREVDRPLNVLLSRGLSPTVPELLAMGVRRISTGAGLARAAYGELVRAARELQESGTREYLERAIPPAQLEEILRGASAWPAAGAAA